MAAADAAQAEVATAAAAQAEMAEAAAEAVAAAAAEVVEATTSQQISRPWRPLHYPPRRAGCGVTVAR